MYNDYMYAIDRSDEYLEHYGIKGMRWGVRKAIERGGTGLGNRRLARQYRKAQKKLAKLEKRANSGAKYARRAAALGAGAALAGGLAAQGTRGVSVGMHKIAGRAGQASQAIGKGLVKGAGVVGKLAPNSGIAGKMSTAGVRMMTPGKVTGGISRAAGDLATWGNKTHNFAFDTATTKALRGQKAALERQALRVGSRQIQNGNIGKAARTAADYTQKAGNLDKAISNSQKHIGVTNNTIARVGAGALAAGLAGAAGYNAYRAATTKRAAQKAADFRKEMNKTFAGTAYGKQGGSKKRRRR